MKKVICTLLILGLLGTLWGCQPTPEGDVVANKGDGVLEQRIAQAQEQEKQAAQWQEPDATPTPSPEPYVYPESWEMELDLTNFLVHIAVEEGSIDVPDAPYPIVRLSAGSFTDMGDTLGTLMELLMPERLGKRQGYWCYEDYVKEMEGNAMGRYDFDNHVYRPYEGEEKEEADREMAELAEKLKTALHEDEYDEDGTLVTEIGTKYTYGTPEGKRWYVTIEENYFAISRTRDTGYRESWFINQRDTPDEPYPTPYAITVTEETAIEKAQAVLDFFPGVDWELESAERAALLEPVYYATQERKAVAQGYLLTYKRRVGDTYFFNYRNSHSGRLHFEEATYSATLELETLTVLVDEKGVQCITWENPVVVEETVANHVELMPFETIQNNFVQLLKAGLSWADEHPPYGGKLNPSRIAWVREMKLAYAYVQEKDRPGKYLAVPTWFFIYRTENELEGNQTVIAINAVDGTRIGW